MNLSSRPGIYSAEIVSAPTLRWAPEELAQRQDFGGIGMNGSFPSDDVNTNDFGDDAEHGAITVDQKAEEDEQARLAAEAKLQDAYTSGYEEGRLTGEIAEGVRLRNAIAAAETALDDIREHEAVWQTAVHENIAALAISVARHVIGRELNGDVESVAELVRRALAEFPIDQPIRIRVNPHDLSVLSAYTTQHGNPLSIAPNRDVRWHADARLMPGGCIVEGRERIIDGRIDTALERLYRRMTYTNV